MREIDDRTGTEPKTIYTFKGLAEIRASHLGPDFMVSTAVELHEDGTHHIHEASFEGRAYVWGEDADGDHVWRREDDEVARGAVATWLATDGIEKARELSRAASPEVEQEHHAAEDHDQEERDDRDR